MSASSRKPLGQALKLPVRYLLSGQYRDGELVEGSVRPLANQLLAVAVVQLDGQYSCNRPTTELWSSNGEGFLDRLDNDFGLADRVPQLPIIPSPLFCFSPH